MGDDELAQIRANRLAEMQITRKRASTEAYDAFSPYSLMRVRNFFTQSETFPYD